MKNPMLTVTIYPGCELTEDEIEAVHDAAIDALPEHARTAVSAAHLVDALDANDSPTATWRCAACDRSIPRSIDPETHERECGGDRL